MIRRLATLILAAVAPAAAAWAQTPLPAPGQPPLPEPNAEALELARLIAAWAQGRAALREGMREELIVERLLDSFGPDRPCDGGNAECRAAAVAIAREFAPIMRQRERDMIERMFAYSLADILRPEQIRRMTVYLRTEDGRQFLEAWVTLHGSGESPRSRERLQQVERQVTASLPDPYFAAEALFRQRTARLPRAPDPPVPRVSPPSPRPPLRPGGMP